MSLCQSCVAIPFDDANARQYDIFIIRNVVLCCCFMFSKCTSRMDNFIVSRENWFIPLTDDITNLPACLFAIAVPIARRNLLSYLEPALLRWRLSSAEFSAIDSVGLGQCLVESCWWHFLFRLDLEADISSHHFVCYNSRSRWFTIFNEFICFMMFLGDSRGAKELYTIQIDTHGQSNDIFIALLLLFVC